MEWDLEMFLHRSFLQYLMLYSKLPISSCNMLERYNIFKKSSLACELEQYCCTSAVIIWGVFNTDTSA